MQMMAASETVLQELRTTIGGLTQVVVSRNNEVGIMMCVKNLEQSSLKTLSHSEFANPVLNHNTCNLPYLEDGADATDHSLP